MKPNVIDRKYGYYNVSISTSLALEGFFHTGEYESNLGAVLTDRFDVMMVNLRTLFRNAFNAFEEGRDYIDGSLMYECVLEDMINLIAVLSEAAPNIKVEFYFCEYTKLDKMFPRAKFRNSNTPKQMVYEAIEREVYTNLCEFYDIKVFETWPSNSKRTLLLSHFPLDLVDQRERFPQLTLLESHTGKLKGSSMWYTKINGKKENIPFCKAMLVIYGDNVMFGPQDLKVRNVIAKCAEKYKWTQATTLERVIACLKLINEPHAAEFVRANK